MNLENRNLEDRKLENKKPQLASRSVVTLILVSGTILILSLSTHFSSAQSGGPAPFSHALPPLDGSHLRAIVVEVNYAPGEADKPHSHPCTVIGYVAQGAIRFQVKGGPESVYKAGESFYEPPNGVHQVSANASDKEPARLIAFFVCDHDPAHRAPDELALRRGGS